MKVIIFLLIILQISYICSAAAYIESFKDPKHPGKCVLGPKSILSPGNYNNPDASCRNMKCNADGTIEFTTCPVRRVRPPIGCTLMDPDLGVDFPYCCEPIELC